MYYDIEWLKSELTERENLKFSANKESLTFFYI